MKLQGKRYKNILKGFLYISIQITSTTNEHFRTVAVTTVVTTRWCCFKRNKKGTKKLECTVYHLIYLGHHVMTDNINISLIFELEI